MPSLILFAHPSNGVLGLTAAAPRLRLAVLDRMFTGEEYLGRYLDLVAFHERHSNLGHGIKRVNYLQYLDDFDAFDKLPRQAKTDAYAKWVATEAHMCNLRRRLADNIHRHRYLQALLDYLKSFYTRAFPLKDLDREMEAVIADFNASWERGTVRGWNKEDGNAQSNGTSSAAGMWCDACQRSYAKQTVYDAHLTSKNHVKKAAALAANGGSVASTNGQQASTSASSTASTTTSAAEKQRATALLEFQINHLVSDYDSPLLVVRNDTKANVERKQALTDRERALENDELEERERREAEEAAARAERRAAQGSAFGGEDGEHGDGADGRHGGDDDDEERLYNPLKLPLGWDGKPIPYWLYKLHGLGVEYSCEICSNFSYRGR